ncbi:MAG: diacylglycerol/lipid kinase family protein [Persicimonas sp.]
MSLNYRTFVVANPKAGAGAVEEEWGLIERLLRARIPELDFAFTEGPDHATLLAREALRSGWDMVVAVGGDGTVNEVINGFFAKPDTDTLYEIDDQGWMRRQRDGAPELINPQAVLGVLPLGTGGDFRRSVGLMGGHRESIEHLSGQETRQIDLGEVGFVDDDGCIAARYFINIASAGFSGAVDRIANKSWKGFGAKPSFLFATARAFARYKNVDLELRLDDTVEIADRMNNLVVANGEFFGGGMWIAPGAELDDGKFQVVVMGDLKRRETIMMVFDIYQGKHLQNKKVFRRRASRVSARCVGKQVAMLDIDGEAPGKLPALWTNHHKTLRLKV